MKKTTTTVEITLEQLAYVSLTQPIRMTRPCKSSRCPDEDRDALVSELTESHKDRDQRQDKTKEISDETE